MDKPLKMNFFKQIYFDSLNTKPIQQKKKEEEKVHHEKTQRVTQTSTNEDKYSKVLIVDDSQENRDLMVAYLKNENIQLELATNGQEAIKKSKEQIPDLIFMDMQMPIMDGIKATQLIRATGFKNPIYALTANVFEEEKKAALASGCDQYIAKPVSKKKIIELVNKLRS